MAKTSFKVTTKSSTSSGSDMNSLIAKKAYELYEKRGRQPGRAMDDWLEAERIVKGKSSR
jgi:hypothetical protein